MSFGDIIMSNHTLTKAEQLLVKEYELRAGQMLHADKLRHQLITFVITLSTAVIGGLAYLYRFYCYSQLNSIIIIFNLLLIIIIFSIIIIAKIRRSQLELNNICSNIRDYFYKQNYEYYIINILLKSEFPTEPNYRKPSQTLCFVYLLSLLNSCVFLYLLIEIMGFRLLYTIPYLMLSIYIFMLHIHLYEYFVKYKFKPYLL